MRWPQGGATILPGREKQQPVTAPKLGPRSLICGCAGTVLSAEETDFFSALQPLGFILMGRNCDDPEQVKQLVQALRACVRHTDVPILIDVEGGRVARLKPPHWPVLPPAAVIGALYKYDSALGIEMAGLSGRIIGQELAALGITVDCAPVLDVAHPETHDAIGDRAFSADPAAVGQLGQAFAEGLLVSGVLPVIKHLPGHGHTTFDPHLALPVVLHDRTIVAKDFAPFKLLAAMPLGMTCHILFEKIDGKHPVSQSAAMHEIIRREIGFGGLLISDDLDMKALGGTLTDRAEKVLAAGTDVALVCNADIHELAALCELPAMPDVSWERWQRACGFLRRATQAAGNLPALKARMTHLTELAKSHVLDEKRIVSI